MARFFLIGVILAISGFVSYGYGALAITAADIQQDEAGYFYRYELTRGDLVAGSTKFTDDVVQLSNIGVYSGDLTSLEARYIYAEGGQFSASFKYAFDLTAVKIWIEGIQYNLVVDSVRIRDKFQMFNNKSGTERTTARSQWSTDDVNYTDLTVFDPPPLWVGPTTVTGDQTMDVTGYERRVFYEVTFTNATADGFDALRNDWNYLESGDTDYFLVEIRLRPTQSPAGSFAGGDGSSEAPFEIATADQLVSLRSYPGDWDKCFILVSDIDMSGYGPYDRAFLAWNEDGDIDFQGTPFTGTFDGDGHCIRNLNLLISAANKKYHGMFGKTEGGQIRNLSLQQMLLKTVDTGCAGLLAGQASGFGTFITNCHVQGSILCEQQIFMAGGLMGYGGGTVEGCSASLILTGGDESGYIGGIAGFYSGSIINCHSSVSIVTGENTRPIGGTGGLAGFFAAGTIEACNSEGLIVCGAGQNSIGGLVGYQSGYPSSTTVKECFSMVQIRGDSPTYSMGGLVGFLEGESGVIENCYAGGLITAGDSSQGIGGLLGKNTNADMTVCYSTCAVSGGAGAQYIAGLVGKSSYNTETYSGCFWNTQTSGVTDGVGNADPDPAGVFGLPGYLMKMRTTFSAQGWDFAGETANGSEDIWVIIENQTYPRFSRECYADLAGDLDGNCRVDFEDFIDMASNWLECVYMDSSLCN